jgi:hypothetical protein
VKQGIFRMFTKKTRITANILIISALLFSGIAALTYGQMPTQTCEACGMMVAADAQAHLKVVDSTGTTHYVDCLKCALRLLKTYGELNVTATCDWNGPAFVIGINLKNYTDGHYVNSTVVNPTSALFIDGGCTKNRVVYNQAAADALLSNNGTSQYMTMMQNVTIPSNATVLTIPQAATMYAFVASPDPTPTPTPTQPTSPTFTPTPTAKSSPSATPTKTSTPTATPTPTAVTTQTCETCGMDVPANAQAKYTITDGNGTVHYAECYMCALQLVNKYDQVNITSYCDWYGPDYIVTVQSSQYGKAVNVTPSTAMFLNGGSCVINRVAYNQTATDALLANGFSMYTLPEQHYDLPSGTNVTTVTQEALTLAKNTTDQTPTLPYPIIIVAFAGIAIIALSFVAYKKLKFNKD